MQSTGGGGGGCSQHLEYGDMGARRALDVIAGSRVWGVQDFKATGNVKTVCDMLNVT
ncbi:hypothetical protein RSAG8_09780, partial [Rhizoctonia solani AG-8 WAC10335]